MSKKKLPPTARKKGGAQFPRIDLKVAATYSKKLVSKTHVGPQPEAIILKGVFNNAFSTGKIRASALKQFKLMQGESAAYEATPLAQKINSAPPEEGIALLRQACLEPKVFRQLFDTFHGDTVSRAKVRQQALALKVHPDSGDDCVKVFLDSLVFAQLAQQVGDDFQISSATKPPVALNGNSTPASIEESSGLTDGADGEGEQSDGGIAGTSDQKEKEETKKDAAPLPPGAIPTPRAQMNISLTLDSTMDPEKLEKYMKILWQYGAFR